MGSADKTGESYKGLTRKDRMHRIHLLCFSILFILSIPVDLP